MKRVLQVLLFPLKIVFSPIIYIFKKLPFATRRKLISNTTGFLGFVGKFFIILQHMFSYEKGGRDTQGGSGLMYLILLLFGGFVLWAYFAKFDQVITAEGKVFPFSRLQEIEHYEGGLLDKIHVKRGEAVRKNQLLVSLSPLSADSDFNIQKANIALLLIKKARLEAEYLTKSQFSISEDIKEKYIQILKNLENKGCKIIGDNNIRKSYNKKIRKASIKDWSKEYLAPIVSVKSVKNIDEAINHINKYGTMHTDCIITQNKKSAKKFLDNVKSSIAMHNTSTQFADGEEFGFGGEVGISTNTLPPRGPVGLNQLVSYKYQVTSKGVIRK